jgi:oligopeptide transport system substrate-binding protein
MKKLSAILSIIIISAILTSCGSSDNSADSDGSGYMYNASLFGNPKSLDPQYADDESSNTVIANLYSGLLRLDSSGNIVCCNALNYSVSDDGLTYTFNLRDDNYWFFDKNDDDKIDDDEYFRVTADDYVFALQRILDPDMKSPYAEEFSCIQGGASSLAGEISPKETGVESVGTDRLVIHLEYASADFINLMTTAAAYPCNEEFFLSTKGRYGLDDNSVMSNGAFFVRQWFYDQYGNNNILYMKQNTVNSNDDNEIYPSYLSFTIEKKSSAIEELFKDGDIDCMTSMSAGTYNQRKYTISSSRSMTLGLIFGDDDDVCSNIQFRSALAMSVNRDELSEQLGDDVEAAYGIIPPAITLLGRSYRDLCSDKGYGEYNKDAALECLEKAKSELGVESFDGIKLLVSTDTIDAGFLHAVTRQWQDVLGCYISIEEVTASDFESSIADGDYQLALYPVTGNYNSGISVLEQFAYDDVIKVSDELCSSIASLRTVGNFSELVTEFSDIESRILEENNFIPLFYKNTYMITRNVNEDIVYNPFTGAVDYRDAKNFD